MTQYDLSVLIPARNEMFLAKTVENILLNKRGATEILIALDGQWSEPQIPDHPDVTILYLPESIGQRAATNQLARLSQAKYVMKLDAHCALDEGFDVKMIAEMETLEKSGKYLHYTLIPAMYNLHGFDWVCPNEKCKSRQYQGPSQKYKKCPKCGQERVREVIWKPRLSRRTTSWRFDTDLHFQYWGGYEGRPESVGDVVEIMSAQGSCFMVTREQYFELDICDEGHGSWGQQGVEVACKTWLSGGGLFVNKKTWYSHLFRTQGGDFGFPYPQSGTAQEKARIYSKDLWLNDKWEKAIHPLSWLIEKFAPIPDWHEPDTEKDSNKVSAPVGPSKGIIFYTDNQLNLKIASRVQNQLKKAGLPITSASLKPMNFGTNVHLPLKRGYLTMAKQILAALEQSKEDIVFFCEHDVLYHPSHFDFIPEKKDVYYYDTNVWRVRSSDGFALRVNALQQLSGLCGYRETLLQHFRKRVEIMEARLKAINMVGLSEDPDKEFADFVRSMGFEPGTHGRPERVDDLKAENWESKYPNIDIRHESNLTPSRWEKEKFRNQRYTEGWVESTLDKIQGWYFSNDAFAK